MLQAILLAAAALLTSFLFRKLRYIRYKQYQDIPQLPTSLLWGHLKIMGEFMSNGIPDRHLDKIFEEMWIAIGRPPVMFVDLRPLTPPMLLVSTHEVAEQVSKPSKRFPLSPTKSPTLTFMAPIIGMTSIIGKEHLWTLLPLILEKTIPFTRYLDQFADSGEVFSMEKLTSNLTFDIIGAAIMDYDLHTQEIDRSKQGELTRMFGELLRLYSDDKNNLPWWLNPRLAYKRRQLGRRIDNLVRNIIRQQFAEAKAQPRISSSTFTKDAKTILTLSFQETDTLTPEALTETSDQVRTFFFGGHDSLNSLLQWIFYELSRTPRALKAVRNELDSILGPETGPAIICARLLQHGNDVFPKMRYIKAMIKESLRLHPPASTVRLTAPGSGFTLHTPADGKDYSVDGLMMYSCQFIIQRDPAVFGDTADVWVPERWLGEAGKGIPATSWRPYERGPRNCIGQELANLESRVIIAIIARKYDFVKVGLGETVVDEKGRPELDNNGQFVVAKPLYNVSAQYYFF
ncbi:cytochrome P450 [Podospora appendiculata]|uniref:Cytochrome P450 n=1 Tax=Podospora appendiculata TaxID=314037 RepID=A0AAE1CDR7_9PEZI|nr:cytochrome P450 [Podospora appendiculata]